MSFLDPRARGLIAPNGRAIEHHGLPPTLANRRATAQAREAEHAPPRNQFGAASFPPIVCRRLKAGDPQPFEWWDEDTGRWARGDMLPPALVKLLPRSERERVEAHRWRWIGMQAEAVHACPRA